MRLWVCIRACLHLRLARLCAPISSSQNHNQVAGQRSMSVKAQNGHLTIVHRCRKTPDQALRSVRDLHRLCREVVMAKNHTRPINHLMRGPRIPSLTHRTRLSGEPHLEIPMGNNKQCSTCLRRHLRQINTASLHPQAMATSTKSGGSMSKTWRTCRIRTLPQRAVVAEDAVAVAEEEEIGEAGELEAVGLVAVPREETSHRYHRPSTCRRFLPTIRRSNTSSRSSANKS